MIERKCKCCSKLISVREADVKRGWGLYCSKSCKAKAQERKTGQYKAYMNGKGISNLHPERLEKYGKDGYFDDTHPFSPDALGQW